MSDRMTKEQYKKFKQEFFRWGYLVNMINYKEDVEKLIKHISGLEKGMKVLKKRLSEYEQEHDRLGVKIKHVVIR